MSFMKVCMTENKSYKLFARFLLSERVERDVERLERGVKRVLLACRHFNIFSTEI